MQVDVTLLQQGGSTEEPAADENRFELVLKKLKGIAVGSFGILQIPISFKAQSLEESTGEVQIVMDGAAVTGQTLTEPLLWQYPIKVWASCTLSLRQEPCSPQQQGLPSTPHSHRGIVSLADDELSHAMTSEAQNIYTPCQTAQMLNVLPAQMSYNILCPITPTT